MQTRKIYSQKALLNERLEFLSGNRLLKISTLYSAARRIMLQQNIFFKCAHILVAFPHPLCYLRENVTT